jgi:hypothetical protein
MKQSWVVGTIALYMILMGLQMIVSGTFSTSSTGVGSELYAEQFPAELAPHTDPDSGQSSVEIEAGTIATSIWNVGQMAMLYFPALYQGNYVWFWWIFCFPIALSFWVVMFTIFRGVGST